MNPLFSHPLPSDSSFPSSELEAAPFSQFFSDAYKLARALSVLAEQTSSLRSQNEPHEDSGVSEEDDRPAPPAPPPSPKLTGELLGIEQTERNEEMRCSGFGSGPSCEERSPSLKIGPKYGVVKVVNPMPLSNDNNVMEYRRADGTSSHRRESKDSEEIIYFDLHGTRFSLPFDMCSNLESTRAELVKTIKWDDQPILFWIGDIWIFSCTWTTYVKPGVTIALYGLPYSSLPPPPQVPPVPSNPTVSEASPAVKTLQTFSDIYTVEGPYKLPYFGYNERVVTIRHIDGMTAFAQLEIYQELRTRAPQNRWANLSGKALEIGRVKERDDLEVCLRRDPAGSLPELLSKRHHWYIDIVEGVVRKFREKDEAAHLDGDLVHKWDRYASKELQEVGRQRNLCSGFSIVASWEEFVMTRDEAENVGLIGIEIATDSQNCKIFAVVGSKILPDSVEDFVEVEQL